MNKSAWNRGIAADVKRAKLRKEGKIPWEEK